MQCPLARRWSSYLKLVLNSFARSQSYHRICLCRSDQEVFHCLVDSTLKCNRTCCLRPIRGEMFIEHATAKGFFSLQRSETSVGLTHHDRKHCAPLERHLLSS